MVASVLMPVKELFKAKREEKGMTQQQLANAAGVSLSFVAQLESGRIDDPRVSTLRRLAEALGLKLDDVADEFGRHPKAKASEKKPDNLRPRRRKR